MVLIETANGRNYVFDCNVKEDNERRVLNYISSQIGDGTTLDAFICSHRDADHIRGVKKLHARFPVRRVWDSDYPGTTTDSPEYREYMDLRRKVGNRVIKKRTRDDFGRTRFRYLSSKDDRLSANAQGIVIKLEHLNPTNASSECATILPGDSDAETWHDGILKDYAKSELSSDILMAAHHGSLSFFEYVDGEKYYTDHIAAIRPAITIVSVGPNSHGHPNKDALRLYKNYSTGGKKGEKVYRTDQKRTMKLEMKSGGSWSLSFNQ